MTTPGVLAPRSPAEWAARVALALIAAVLAYGAVRQALAATVQRTDLERAHRLAPANGQIAGKLAATLSRPNAGFQDRMRADQLAIASLQHDPTVVPAAATLGLDLLAHGEPNRAARLLRYAEFLSRRDLRTELWAIQDAVSREDVGGAIDHYDIALRTSEQAPNLLYPVLAAAVVDPEVRRALSAVLGRRPAWGPSFLDFAAGQGPDPSAAAALLAALRLKSLPTPPGAEIRVVDRLLAEGHVDEAWSYYHLLRPGTDRRASRDPDFTGDHSHPTAFDWNAANDGGLYVSFRRTGGASGVAEFSALANAQGTLLRQTQSLPPRRYLLSGTDRGTDRADEPRLYWTITCRGGKEIARTYLSDHPNGGSFAVAFDVPADCLIQDLALTVPPSDSLRGKTGEIHRAQIRAERQ